jgi:hypothetical protein
MKTIRVTLIYDLQVPDERADAEVEVYQDPKFSVQGVVDDAEVEVSYFEKFVETLE